MIFDPTLLPFVGAFLFVFAIVAGLLSTADLFNKSKNVNIIIAAVIGLFAAIYEPFVTGIQTYIPVAAAILIVLFFFVFIKKLFGKKEGQQSKFDALPLGIALVSLLLVLISQWNYVRALVPAGWDATNVAWVLGVIVVLIIFWIAYKHNPAQ